MRKENLEKKIDRFNYENLKDITCIIVDKTDWTVAFSSKFIYHHFDEKKFLKIGSIEHAHTYLFIHGEVGVWIIIEFLSKILTPFSLVENNHEGMIFVRDDWVERWVDEKTTEKGKI